MRRWLLASSAVLLIGASTTGPSVAGTGGDAGRVIPAVRGYYKPNLSRFRADFVPGKVLVQFRNGLARSAERSVTDTLGARVLAHVGTFGVDVVGLPAGLSVRSAIRSYLADPNVLYAEPDVRRYPSATIPNDPSFAEQWGLANTGQAHGISDPPPATAVGTSGADIKATNAWDVQKGNAYATVAVLDTGVEISHPDLAANIWVNPGEIPGNGIDDDGNGFVDDVNGWNFVDNNNNPSPGTGPEDLHGTHVAGIIGAVQGNAIGISGVCPGCKIMPIRFAFDTATEIQGIAYAVDNGATILNASFGGGTWSSIERSAIQQAGAAGLLMVVAAANNAADNDMSILDKHGNPLSPNYPASYDLPNILSVAASNHNDEYGYFTGCATVNPVYQCLFTNWGHDSVDVAAPGVDIYSTVPVASGSYMYLNGTSMAAPQVAGVAGLVKSQNPSYTPEQVKNAIMNSVDHPANLAELNLFSGGPWPGAFTRTSGRVNALAALTGSTAEATPLTDGNVDGAVAISTSEHGSVRWPDDVNDVYKKQLLKGHRYVAILKGPSGQDFDLWVWRTGTPEIWAFTPGCFGAGGPCPIAAFSAGKTADEAVAFKAGRSGVYYFQVSSFFSVGSYTLTIKKVS